MTQAKFTVSYVVDPPPLAVVGGTVVLLDFLYYLMLVRAPEIPMEGPQRDRAVEGLATWARTPLFPPPMPNEIPRGYVLTLSSISAGYSTTHSGETIEEAKKILDGLDRVIRDSQRVGAGGPPSPQEREEVRNIAKDMAEEYPGSQAGRGRLAELFAIALSALRFNTQIADIEVTAEDAAAATF